MADLTNGSPGRSNQRYIYETAVNWYSLASTLGKTVPLSSPDPSEPENVLLKKLAYAVYSTTAGGINPPSPCTDNAYLCNIANNLGTYCNTIQVGGGRPDQVYAFIIDTIMYAPSAVRLAYSYEPNQGDTINVLLQNMAGLSYVIASIGSFSGCV
jgi:hypothetical protein